LARGSLTTDMANMCRGSMPRECRGGPPGARGGAGGRLELPRAGGARGGATKPHALTALYTAATTRDGGGTVWSLARSPPAAFPSPDPALARAHNRTRNVYLDSRILSRSRTLAPSACCPVHNAVASSRTAWIRAAPHQRHPMRHADEDFPFLSTVNLIEACASRT
jgi:hypothetical protein